MSPPSPPRVPALSDRFERLYTMLLDAIPSSVLLIDPKLRVVSANRNFLEKGQRTVHSTIGHRLEDVFPEVIVEQMGITRQVQDVLRANEALRGKRMTYRAPGVPIRIYYYSLIPFSWQGRTEGVILLMDDVTEQVRLSEEVRQVERHLASIVESASDLILSTDRLGRIMTWNGAAERLLGFSAAEATGRNLAEFCADEDQTEIGAIFARIDAQNSAQTRECPVKTKQSTFILVSWVFSPLPDRSSQTVGVVAVGRDLTEWRKLEMQLIQSQKLAALGVMAGGIAHEIRNPLAICSSAAQFLMEEEGATPEFHRECADKIHRAIQRASSIIENLLRYAHPATPSRTAAVNVVLLIQEALTSVSHHAALNKVQTKVSFPRSDIMVQGVAVLLQQVFMNLFLNAIDAMPTGGGLTVDIRAVEGTAQILVVDTGHGIAKRDIEKIFDPFYTTSAVGKGSGLGLSICYSIVKQHAGSIEVESTEGNGSTFTVRLPIHGARGGS